MMSLTVSRMCFLTRVARFFLVHDTKPGKMYQLNTKCTKWSQSIPNVRKIFQMAIKYSSIFPSPKFAQLGIFGLKINHLATLFLT
jgi:hypothetical protein